MNDTVVTLDDAIDVAMQLPLEQRDMLVEILRQRRIDSRREEIAQAAQEAINAFREGRLTPQPVEKIIQELHDASGIDV